MRWHCPQNSPPAPKAPLRGCCLTCLPSKLPASSPPYHHLSIPFLNPFLTEGFLPASPSGMPLSFPGGGQWKSVMCMPCLHTSSDETVCSFHHCAWPGRNSFLHMLIHYHPTLPTAPFLPSHHLPPPCLPPTLPACLPTHAWGTDTTPSILPVHPSLPSPTACLPACTTTYHHHWSPLLALACSCETQQLILIPQSLKNLENRQGRPGRWAGWADW